MELDLAWNNICGTGARVLLAAVKLSHSLKVQYLCTHMFRCVLLLLLRNV